MDDPRSAPESLLAFDIGSVHTRAMLFDVAGDRYHFVAQGRAQTTAGAPYFDVGEGCRLAVDELEKISGRVLVSKDDRLILPAQPDGSGVDTLVSTLSAGEAVSAVAVGLLEEVSLESARRLIGSTYARLTESIGLNDRRQAEVQIDAIIQARPDVIVVAGGTEHGAARSITRVLEMVGLASYLIPAGKRPVLLYAGNQEVAARVKGQFETMQVVRTAPNIRPGFDHEDLGPAQNCLAEIVQKIRASRLAGMAELTNLSNGHSYPAAQAFGRMVRFLSKVYDSDKGVLGIDLGASSTVIAAAISGNLSLSVQTPLGMGAGLAGIAGRVDPAEISQWLPFQVSAEDVEDFLQQKIAASDTLPESMEDQMLEEAVARVVIRRALSSLTPPPSGPVISAGGSLAGHFEPILVAGSVLAGAPTPGQAALVVLDALQPRGVTTLVLDANNLTAALGAAAGVNSLLPVQILESGAYQNLGTVIAPTSSAPVGAPILKGRLVALDGSETELEVSQGSLHVFPLPRGQSAQLYLEPVGSTELGIGRAGRGIKVSGGTLGLIIDGRGRPLRLPADPGQRQELIKKWLWALGG